MDDTVWHKCRNPIIPRRTIDGRWTRQVGQTWRRLKDGKWQYRQDDETEEEFFERS